MSYNLAWRLAERTHLWLLQEAERLPPLGTCVDVLAAFPFATGKDGSLGPHGEFLVNRTLYLSRLYKVRAIVCMGGWPGGPAGEREGRLFHDRLVSRAEELGIILPECLPVETSTQDTWEQRNYLIGVSGMNVGKVILAVAIPEHLKRVRWAVHTVTQEPYWAKTFSLDPEDWQLSSKRATSDMLVFSLREVAALAAYRIGLAALISAVCSKKR